MLSTHRFALTFLALMTVGASVHAQKAGDNFIGVGVAAMAPKVSLGTLTSVGPAAGPFNAATAGASADADTAYTLSLSYLHMFTDNVATEVSIGVPPKVTLDVQLKTSSHPGAATADVLTPTLVAKYLFNIPGDAWRPYVGLGLTYASFRSVRANSSDPLVNALGGGSASLSSSWAPVYNAGFIYNINDRFSINASISYIPLKAKATFFGSGTTTTGTVKLNPTDYVVRIGYKF